MQLGVKMPQVKSCAFPARHAWHESRDDWCGWSAGGSGRGRQGQAGQPGSQLAAELAQRMSDQARGPGAAAFAASGSAPGQHLFASIAAWLNRLNDAGGSRSWPNIELPYPDNSNAPACSVQDFAEAARAVWEMGGWAADEPASAFLQASTEDVTFGRWLPEQAPAAGEPPAASAAAAAAAGAATSAAGQPQHGSEAPRASSQQPPPAARGAHSAAVQPGVGQPTVAAAQPQPQLQAMPDSDVLRATAHESAGHLAAAITNALSNQERDSNDHLASGSASTGSLSSIVVCLPAASAHVAWC